MDMKNIFKIVLVHLITVLSVQVLKSVIQDKDNL